MASIQTRFDRSFVDQIRSARGNTQGEGKGFRSEELQRSIEERRSRGRGRGKKENVDPTAPVVIGQPVETPPSTPPTPPTPPPTNQSPAPGTAPSNTDGSVRSLAEKYVDVYAQQSGKTLSSATKDALVADVAAFYGENSTRTDRLRTLVGVY